MPKTRTRTIRFRIKIQGQLQSVVRWWSSPERYVEQQAIVDRRKVLDYSWVENFDDEIRTVNAKWTTRRGLEVNFRVSAAAIEATRDGTFVGRQTTWQHRRHPHGREDTSESERVLEFRSVKLGETIVESTTMVRSTVRRLPQVGEKIHRYSHLTDLARRCQSELMDSKL